ncbi:MAG TPA: cation diffusion facilitator family transporter [Burkholderiales bacterium]|nr:cation diffusion facilitator family transporter [Burkholderiales bacterium]
MDDDHVHDHARHGHAHGHAHHAHPARDGERRVFWVLLLTAGFMVVEAVGGWLAGSLALIADAGHMLSDAAALALAWAAFRVARRPHDEKRSYGYHRFQILAAFVNGILLLAIAAWILVEAAGRLRAPQPVLAQPMLAIAVAGLLVNVVAFLVLSAGDRRNLNVSAALMHVLGDLFGSVGAIVAAIVILASGWTPIDPILSVLVSLLILRGAWDITRRAGHVLMEGAPEGFDDTTLKADLRAAVPGVLDVHHVHAWMLTSERPIVTLHVRLAPAVDPAVALAAIKSRLKDRFGIAHSTVQIESAECVD